MEADVSAGGVVIREERGRRSVLLIADRWGFMAPPKGHLETGETSEEAAVREVQEETGVRAIVKLELGPMRYRFPGRDGRPIHKTVRYFLMEPVGGSLRPQPGETLGAQWVTEHELPGIKTYSGTLLFLERAMEAFRELKRLEQ